MAVTALTHTDSDLVELLRAGLDLPDDAADAADIVRRLANPPAGRRTVALGVRTGTGSLAGAVLGSVDPAEPGIGYVDLIAVHPEHRRAGLGRELLSTMESTLDTQEVRLAGHVPCYAWPGVDVRYTPAVCLALRCGYERHRTAWNMTVPLAGVPSPEGLLGFSVRAAKPDDRAVLLPWVRDTWNDSWAWEVAESIGRPDAGCLVAWREGRPVGFAAWGALRPTVFGPMGTDESAQGRGVGRALLLGCLAQQRARGLTHAQIGWVGPVPFYAGAAGAFIERVFFLFRKTTGLR